MPYNRQDMKKLIAIVLILVLALNAALLLSGFSDEAKAERKAAGFANKVFGGKSAQTLVLPSLLRF